MCFVQLCLRSECSCRSISDLHSFLCTRTSKKGVFNVIHPKVFHYGWHWSTFREYRVNVQLKTSERLVLSCSKIKQLSFVVHMFFFSTCIQVSVCLWIRKADSPPESITLSQSLSSDNKTHYCEENRLPLTSTRGRLLMARKSQRGGKNRLCAVYMWDVQGVSLTCRPWLDLLYNIYTWINWS